MNLITIEQARAHCRADAADDDLLTIYGDAAEEAAQQFLNRRVYADESTLSGARDGVPAMLEAADTAYDDAVEAADDLDGSARCAALDAAVFVRAAARARAREIDSGIVATDDIVSGILLILGHLYRNREDVVTGPAPAALPMGAHALLWPHRIGLGI